ncbi:uncharacterized protein BJ171DRAFT_5177 [Polychytrium aggregatum]|uniref:uncharacterized protein n=1 Tax=Polychytrium aggregatum TaxID=110093 RepID=UPI0022FEEB7B|nr:uncharacterized protein BJ171DRAFT_5177 [Polychytrium aggregatum]KAI9209646.1 hypothetical protein BJ171DRAFT_5177 [Polychytrium aggregatum]
MSEPNSLHDTEFEVPVDEEIEAMKQRVQEMQQEAAKLRDMQASVESSMYAAQDASASASHAPSDANREEVDARSIFVGNVDYSTTPEEIQAHFQACGPINRVTILCDKYTGHPKGFAYVEFADPSVVHNALVLNESLFKGRLLKVTAKRTNIPGLNFRGRGGRAAYRGSGPRGGYRGYSGGGYAGYRGRPPYRARRGSFAPY